MIFTTQAQRRAGEAIDEFASYIEEPAVKSVLDEDIIGKLEDIRDSFYVPNVKSSNAITSTRKARKNPNSLPIFTAEEGKRYFTTDPHVYRPTEKQYEEIKRIFRAWGVNDEATEIKDFMESNLAEVCDDFKLCLPKSIGGTVAPVHFGFWMKNLDRTEFSHPRHFFGRPITLVKASIKPPQLGLTMVHEAIHVAQNLDQPIRRDRVSGVDAQRGIDRQHARSEVEAYSIQAFAAIALYHGSIKDDLRGNPELLDGHHMNVEAVRVTENADSEDPYRVTLKMLRELGRIGLDLFDETSKRVE